MYQISHFGKRFFFFNEGENSQKYEGSIIGDALILAEKQITDHSRRDRFYIFIYG
jgi:hypothetical protein